MNDPAGDSHKTGSSERHSIRSVQQLIDEQPQLSAHDFVVDGDVDACVQFLKESPFVDLHLVSSAWETQEGPNETTLQPTAETSQTQRWKLEYRSILGTGGFAVVLQVQVSPSGKSYAMKILRPSLRWSKSHQKRFLREAELTSLLTDHRIVPIVGTGLINSSPFILSELIDGPNLGQFLATNGTTLDVKTAVAWARSLAQALQSAHEAGILHRDLKPENILLQRSEDPQHFTPRITDFGLARRFQQSISGSTEFTTGNILVGTARYMAPELATGKISTGSVPADVFSLAAILFQCVTGRVPFDGRGYLDMMAKMISAPAPMAHRLNPQVPHSLSIVLQKALCRTSQLRYQTAAEFDADLERVQQGSPVAARQMRIARKVWDLTTSHPRLTTAFGVLVLIVPAALIVISVLYYREREALEQHRSLLQATMSSVRDYINVSENVLDKIPASAKERYQTLEKALAAQELVARGLDYNQESRYRLSVLQSLLADAAWRMSEAPRSLEHTRNCLDMLQPLVQEDPGNIEYRYDVFYNRMCLETRSTHATDADRISARKATLREIEELNRLSPDNPDYTDALASSYFSLGQALSYIRNPGCQEYLEKSIEISDRLWNSHPDKLLYVKYALLGRSELADHYRFCGDVNTSWKLTKEAMDIAAGIQHPDRHQTWFLEILREPYRSYASTLRVQGRWNDVCEAYRECLDIEDRLYQNNPLHTPYALWRAINAAEELRAARKCSCEPDVEQQLCRQAEDRLESLRKTGQWIDYLPRIEALIASPDAEPVELHK